MPATVCNMDVDLENLIRQLATGVGIAVGVIGILAAFGQLSPLQRLRDLEAWAAARAGDEEAPGRQKVLEQIRLEATARLVATCLVPNRHYFWGAVQLPIGAQLMIGGVDANTGWWSIGGRLALGSFGLWFSIRQIERIWAERYAVKLAYLREAGEVPLPKLGILSRMEGGTRKEFKAAQFVAFGFGYVLLGTWLVFIDRSQPAGWTIVGVGVAVLCWALPALVEAITDWAEGPHPAMPTLANNGLAECDQ